MSIQELEVSKGGMPKESAVGGFALGELKDGKWLWINMDTVVYM